MEYLLEEGNMMKRKYSNKTMRNLKNYIDIKELKSTNEGYNEVLDRLDILLNDKRLRTVEELAEDLLSSEEM